MSDIKPCPFCGNASINVYQGETFRWRYAQCDNCGAHAPEIRIQTLGEGTKEQWEAAAKIEAIEEWNRRFPIGDK
jgi:Lar family restriction alleviation protein